jgi:hypothetical protein
LADAAASASYCFKCGKELDPGGHHAFHCAKNNAGQFSTVGGRTIRHNLVRDAVVTLARGVPVVVQLEPHMHNYFDRRPVPDPVDRRADAAIADPKDPSKRNMADITVVNPNPAAINNPMPGGAADAAAKAKVALYTTEFVIDSAQVRPFALETYGACHSAASDLIRELAQATAVHAGTPKQYPVIVQRMHAATSVALQRGNAEMLRRYAAACLRRQT